MLGLDLTTVGVMAGVIALLFWLAPEVMQQVVLLGFMVGLLMIILLGWERVGNWLVDKLIK